MTYTLRFLPEVENDAINGYIWYEMKSRGLGEDFLRMFYASANEILWNPSLYPKAYQDFHRKLLRRFPYAIYFTTENWSSPSSVDTHRLSHAAAFSNACGLTCPR